MLWLKPFGVKCKVLKIMSKALVGPSNLFHNISWWLVLCCSSPLIFSQVSTLKLVLSTLTPLHPSTHADTHTYHLASTYLPLQISINITALRSLSWLLTPTKNVICPRPSLKLCSSLHSIMVILSYLNHPLNGKFQEGRTITIFLIIMFQALAEPRT